MPPARYQGLIGLLRYLAKNYLTFEDRGTQGYDS
jgi:hypothetical protein